MLRKKQLVDLIYYLPSDYAVRPPPQVCCCDQVLAMEFLEGVSLAKALEAEQVEVASALGYPTAAHMKNELMSKMRNHFAEGGGDKVLLLGTAVAPLVRAYASLRSRFGWLAAHTWNGFVRIVGLLSCGTMLPLIGDLKPVPPWSTVSLSQSIKTLIKVHGCQMLLDGIYNADPHPGNVLVLPDGRLGLIDYGMVGRLKPAARQTIAKVVLALERGDHEAVCGLYQHAGYRACWHRGDQRGETHGPNAVYRFATFHLDRIDLSPVEIAPNKLVSVLEILTSTLELSVPDWVE